MILSKKTEKTDALSASDIKKEIEKMFEAGAHFGYHKSRRHPSTLPFVFGNKDNVEIFDLEKVFPKLEKALAFVEKVTSEGKQVLFVGGKRESQKVIKDIAEKVDMPYVSGRWIGGTLTNFVEIRKRINHFLSLSSQKDKGELGKYTKKERLLLEREMTKLEDRFGGLVTMDKKPGVVFIVDGDRESIARDEAIQENIPVISLGSTDNNFSKIDFPIPANDSSVRSIRYFSDQVAKASQNGFRKAKAAKTKE